MSGRETERIEEREAGFCPCCRVCQLDDGIHHPAGHPSTPRVDAGATDHDLAGHDAAGGSGGQHGAMGQDEHGGSGGEHEGGHAGSGSHAGHEGMFRRRFWVCLALSVPVLLWSATIQDWFGYAAPTFPGSWLIVPVLSTAVFAYGGLPFLRMAGWELRGRSPGMMTLISMAITVAYVFSMATLVFDLGEDFFWELVTLIDIMLLGHWLEMRSVRQASGALDALAKLMPDTAEVVLANGHVEMRPAAELAVGDTFLVRPGASVPADGEVTEGGSEVNEAMITGESLPVLKEPGARVIAGTVNDGNGSLRVRVSAIGDDTALAGIMRLVAEAQESRSSTQLLADRAAALLFWAALAAAGVTLLVWSIIEGGLDQVTIARVVTVLVIACPHALGLAIPLVVANTTQLAAANGVLIRDREAIDTARLLQVIAIDKTGTLTRGNIGVSAIATVAGLDENQALAVAAALEGDSEHLIARAIRDEATSRGLDLPGVSGFEILKGRGVSGVVDGVTIHVGGPGLLESLDTHPDDRLADFAAAAEREAASVVYLVRDGRPVAAFAMADVIRAESYRAVQALHDRGVEVAMLTGDSEAVAASVANELGIDTYRAQVLPADKDSYIADLQKGGRMVAMVGDGVNDAPALARADIGIAIGGGTDVAVESAGLILVKSNPLDIVRILILSAASYRKQLQNIWWGAGYNIVMIPLAAGVLAPFGFIMPPSVGAILMSISTIVVAVNAQLLRRVDLRL